MFQIIYQYPNNLFYLPWCGSLMVVAIFSVGHVTISGFIIHSIISVSSTKWRGPISEI